MGLFDKKYCDICGEKIGLLGNRKLEDGNLCKNCAKKLSPWFDERRQSTVDQIKAQLSYREENKKAVEAFHTTRSFGDRYLICLDEDQRKFLVARTGNIISENPDVLDYSQVTGCELDVDEHRSEEMTKDKDGNEISYNPPRYCFSYDFNIVIRVNHPWFDDMCFQLNSSDVEVFPPAGTLALANPGQRSMEYRKYEQMGSEIKKALMSARQQIRDDISAAAAPKAVVTCPWCGATTTPDASGKCEYCGGAVNA